MAVVAFCSRPQKSVSDFGTVFAFGEKTAVGVQGFFPCEMHFWVVYPPKSAIEYSTYVQRIEIGMTKTVPNYAATKKRLQQNKGGFSMNTKNGEQLSSSFCVDRGQRPTPSTPENNFGIPLDFKAKKCYNKRAEGMS
ncbi:MAG: hypothetical protein NC299_18495 [Lachnospiraceae bacterium]|nr:hypothetical protein [Lachnospiraceae bacterium]